MTKRCRGDAPVWMAALLSSDGERCRQMAQHLPRGRPELLLRPQPARAEAAQLSRRSSSADQSCAALRQLAPSLSSSRGSSRDHAHGSGSDDFYFDATLVDTPLSGASPSSDSWAASWTPAAPAPEQSSLVTAVHDSRRHHSTRQMISDMSELVARLQAEQVPPATPPASLPQHLARQLTP